MLTITHTHEAGTLIDGTSRGDGTAEILKACRWRWGRSIAAWYVPHSCDRQPNTFTINQTAAALREAGFEVTVEVDRTHRSTAEVEADKIARQAARVDALEAKADRKAEKAGAAWDTERRAVESLPEGGEPIKIGHHSETRHRNAIEKAHQATRRAITADSDAQAAKDRVAAATHTTDARYNPVTVANRIEKLGADLRRLDRRVCEAGYNTDGAFVDPSPELQERRRVVLSPRRAELAEQLQYWEGVRAEQIKTGTATGHSRDTIGKGDHVKIRGHWHEVVRVNAKTVSVSTDYSWTDTTPYAEIQQVVPAAELAAAKAKRDAKKLDG